MFNRKDASVIHDEVKQLIEGSGLLEKHGMTLGRSSGSFGDIYKLSLTFERADAEGHSTEAREYLRYCEPSRIWQLCGLKAEHLGATFADKKGHSWKITGFSPNRRKFPLNVVRDDGKKMLYQPEGAARFLGVYKAGGGLEEVPFPGGVTKFDPNKNRTGGGVGR